MPGRPNTLRLRDNTATVTIHSAKHGDVTVVIDRADAEAVRAMQWSVSRTKAGRFHVASRSAGRARGLIYMYHWLNGRPPVGLVTDHINGDVLDNRRSNLRFVSVSGNNQNRRGAEKDNRSGLRGVGSHASGRWRARHVLNGTTVDLGIYDSPEQASAIATQWRRDHFLTGAE